MKIVMGMLLALAVVQIGCAKSEASETPTDHGCKCEDAKSKESLWYGTLCPEKDKEGKFLYSRGHYVDKDGSTKSVCFSVEHKCSCPEPH